MALDLFAGTGCATSSAAKSWYERLLGSEPAFMPQIGFGGAPAEP